MSKRVSTLVEALDFRCAKCGQQLTVEDDWDDYRRWITVKVEPCAKCIEDAIAEEGK